MSKVERLKAKIEALKGERKELHDCLRRTTESCGHLLWLIKTEPQTGPREPRAGEVFYLGVKGR